MEVKALKSNSAFRNPHSAFTSDFSGEAKMTRSHHSTGHRSRSGFTVVELLVVVTVIGILAGIIVPAVMNALGTTKEATVVVEMRQIEMALEQFKTDNGFYPPSFASGLDAYGNVVGIRTAGAFAGAAGSRQLLPYLNRISPQHGEGQGSGVMGGGSLAGGERTRLEHWWMELGRHLDQESSIVFWLSGLCKNRQYPLTDGVVTWVAGTPPTALHTNYPNDSVQRHDYYEFRKGQLEFFNVTDVNNNPVDIASTEAYVAKYSHGYSRATGDFRYKYRDAATYDIGGDATSTWSDAYREGPSDGSETPLPTADPATAYRFANPNKFQIVSPGMDGAIGAAGNAYATEAGIVQRKDDSGADVDFEAFYGEDNLTNFAEGRIGKWLTTIE